MLLARDLAGTVFPVSEAIILEAARGYGIGRKMGRSIIFGPDAGKVWVGGRPLLEPVLTRTHSDCSGKALQTAALCANCYNFILPVERWHNRLPSRNGCVAINTQSEFEDGFMIVPQDTDIGRRVVHKPQRSAPEYGVISAITPRRIFVRFGSQLYSRTVSAADLEFHEPSKARPFRLQRRSVREGSPPLAPSSDHSRS